MLLILEKKKNLNKEEDSNQSKMYQVYILPNCEHCHKAIELMKQKNIEFEQISAGVSDGIARFREFYMKQKDKITRDANGTVVLPVVVYQENGSMRIHQGVEGLERFLGI